MLNAVADALTRHLLQTLPPGQAYRRSALDRLPLPVVHYLSGLLNRHLEAEAALPQSDWFDAEAEIVQTAAASWQAAIRSAAQIPAEAWEEAAQTATQQVLAYLVEPVATLTAWVYDDASAPLPTATVRARMTAFSAYPYLREIAEGYLDRKGLAEITRAEFDRLLQRIDQRMVGSFGPTDWMVLLDPLFTLLRAAPEYDGVPTALLQRFFRAKGFEAFAASLDGPEAYDEAALRAVLQTQPAASQAPMDSAVAEAATEAVSLEDEAAIPPTEPEALEAEPDEVPDSAVPSDGEADEDIGAEPLKDAVRMDVENAAEGEAERAVVPDESPVAFSPMEAEGVVEDDEANAEGAMPYEDEHETPGDGERSETDASEETGTEAVPRTEEPTESSVQQEKRMPEEDEGQPSGEAEDSGHDAAQEEPTEEEPLWKRLARQQGQARSHEVPEDEGEDEPLWKRLAQQEAPLQRLPAPSDAASSESPTADIETTQEDILDVEVVDIEPDPESGGEAPIEPTQAESLRALETRILGPTATERRDWYIQHLTGGSEAEYRVVLGRLDQATTWTQATQIIGADIFRKHQVNIYSDAAIAFTDAVEAYFRS